MRHTLLCGALTLLLIAGPTAAAQKQKHETPLRIVSVSTPVYSGLLAMLAQGFEQETGVKVEFRSSNDPHRQGRTGQADLVISHYGKSGMETFISDGMGHWPRMLFANQAVIIGPKSDPAGIAALNARDAFSRLQQQQSPFVANALPGPQFIHDFLQAQNGGTQPLAQASDKTYAKAAAVRQAEKQQAYVVWGAFPFLRYQAQNDSDLAILVADDPILHRVMASSVVRSDQVSGVNESAARQFEQYVIRTDTQAKIAAFRTMGSERQLWWPYGRHN
ncbi:substrate-binding domain-containing protein [Ferrimonas pelagia]|uniref:Substrate-binding domain-containing protein n=1 Tax=Ferrimonas pelagia TaxID=1177826 RepID=A0ABP9FDP2_9GAMM